MGKIASLRNYRRTYGTPRRPFEKERFDYELRLCGEYGLRCKREVYRVHYALAKMRNRARRLLMLDAKDERRVFEGGALLRRLHRLGILDESKTELDYVLSLKHEDVLNRRLQTLVFKKRIAKSVHHARVMIRQGHIRVGKQIVDSPSFLVRTEAEGHIQLSANSSLAQGKPGRTARKSAAAKLKKAEEPEKKEGDDAADDS